MSTSMTAMSGSVAARKTTVAGGIKPLVRARPASLARTVCRAETKPQGEMSRCRHLPRAALNCRGQITS